MIELTHVSVVYGRTSAVRDVNMSIESGEIVSLVGRSGSGKSSIAHAICGFVPATGTINAPRDIGVVFQDYALFPFMTCGENVGAGLRGMHAGSRRRRIDEMLCLVALSGYADRYPWQLSGGQQQRIAVARALAPNPSCLVMDEPFAAVDILLRDSMTRWLAKLLVGSGQTVIFITHNIQEAVLLSDRILVIDDGRLIETHTIDLERPRASVGPEAIEVHAICQRITESIIGTNPDLPINADESRGPGRERSDDVA